MSEQPLIQVEVSPTFNRNLRVIAKKYRSIRNDIQPVIEQLEPGELPGDQIPDIGYAVFKLRVRNSDTQKGSDTFCYWMLYNFDLVQSIARDFAIIRCEEHPLYDLRLRIREMNANRDIISRSWGEINAPADVLNVKWTLPESAYYRVFFHARNGSWNQDLLLNRSTSAGY
jgi:mRNA-degrading endonuclease RelE of RelBE toxin-antitoxin system